MLVREKNDISQWFKFFLVGIIETANKCAIRCCCSRHVWPDSISDWSFYYSI